MQDYSLMPAVEEQVSQELQDFQPLVRQLLFNRGIKNVIEAEEFFNADYKKLHNPFLFEDMAQAADRVISAIQNNEKICIYGDYDADAVTACAVLGRAMKFLKANFMFYIPDRFSEGYGINLEALHKIKEQQANLIITVDTGTNAKEAGEFCKQNGIDFIITDHHEITGDIPKALAVINPKNPKCDYPDRNITGVGVAFKFVCALFQKIKQDENFTEKVNIPEGYEKWFLDLVAIGTVADCHDLLGENRIYVKWGLEVLKKTKWKGLFELMFEAGVVDRNKIFKKSLDVYTLGFQIAPRLNAAGRLEHASMALELLMDDGEDCREKAAALNKLNSRRQEITEQAVSEARELVLREGERDAIVIISENWSKGIVGLIAGKLAEEFKKPAFVLSKEQNLATGSARTANGVDILSLLDSSAAYLERYGGHKQAAGLTLKTEDFSAFKETVLFALNRTKTDKTKKGILVEAELMPADLNLETVRQLARFEPYGAGNPVPKFVVKSAKIVASKLVGAGQDHWQGQVSVEGAIFPAVGFFRPEFYKMHKIGDTVDVIFEILKDTWNGTEKIKMKIVQFF